MASRSATFHKTAFALFVKAQFWPLYNLVKWKTSRPSNGVCSNELPNACITLFHSSPQISAPSNSFIGTVTSSLTVCTARIETIAPKSLNSWDKNTFHVRHVRHNTSVFKLNHVFHSLLASQRNAVHFYKTKLVFATTFKLTFKSNSLLVTFCKNIFCSLKFEFDNGLIYEWCRKWCWVQSRSTINYPMRFTLTEVIW